MSRQVNKDKLSIMPWINTEYSYKLAKRMEQFRSNPVLGYRPAGSAAEFATGEMLFQEMERIGLKDVHKDAIRVDSWNSTRQSWYGTQKMEVRACVQFLVAIRPISRQAAPGSLAWSMWERELQRIMTEKM